MLEMTLSRLPSADLRLVYKLVAVQGVLMLSKPVMHRFNHERYIVEALAEYLTAYSSHAHTPS